VGRVELVSRTGRFEGHVAVVTGAAQGIGRRVAERLFAEGASVAAWDYDGSGATAFARTMAGSASSGQTAVGVRCNVAAEADVDDAVRRTVEAIGHPSIVVAAAGISRIVPFLEADAGEFRQVLDVNLTGTFLTIQRCARDMVASGTRGHIVAFSSVAGRGPRAEATAYAASKAGVISVVRSAAVALARDGVTVNAVCPGVVDSPMTYQNAQGRADALGISADEALARLVDRIPLGRMQTADDVADVALFLCSDAAGYVTGQALNACGGLEFD
jgi:NAD(P)-dependent dehydrogenase (short-subunit alcohol dehydrogenase family)